MKHNVHRVALAAWILGLLASMAALAALGSRDPGTPPLTRPPDLADWIARHEVLDMAAAFARLIALGLLAYLLLVTIVQLVIGSMPVRGTQPGRIARRLGPSFVAVLTAAVAASAGPASAMGSTTLPSVPQAGPEADAEVGTDTTTPPTIPQPGQGSKMRMLDPRTSLPWSDPTEPAAPEHPAEAPADDVVGVAPQAPVATPDSRPAAAPPAATPPAVPVERADAHHPGREAPGRESEWVVRPGDHLWSIAENTVRARSGAAPGVDGRGEHEPDEREVARYWVRLVEENRERLVDPTDADLILPGQHLRLP